MTVGLALPLGLWLNYACLGMYRREDAILALSGEASPTEIATVVLFGLAGLTTLAWSIRSFRKPRRAGLRPWWLLAFGLACLLVAGEEASWGQYILGFDTPEAWAERNVQEEFNLHNVRIPGLRAYWVNDVHWWLVASIGAILPMLLLAWPHFRRAALALDAPVPPWLTMATCFAAAFLMPTDGDLFTRWGPPYNVASEMREFTLAAALVPWVGSMYRGARSPRGVARVTRGCDAPATGDEGGGRSAR